MNLSTMTPLELFLGVFFLLVFFVLLRMVVLKNYQRSFEIKLRFKEFTYIIGIFNRMTGYSVPQKKRLKLGSDDIGALDALEKKTAGQLDALVFQYFISIVVCLYSTLYFFYPENSLFYTLSNDSQFVLHLIVALLSIMLVIFYYPVKLAKFMFIKLTARIIKDNANAPDEHAFLIDEDADLLLKKRSEA